MTLLEKLTEYRRALYVYRAVSQNSPHLGMKEPQPEAYGLSVDECPQAIREVRDEVLAEKKLENPPETSKASP